MDHWQTSKIVLYHLSNKTQIAPPAENWHKWLKNFKIHRQVEYNTLNYKTMKYIL